MHNDTTTMTYNGRMRQNGWRRQGMMRDVMGGQVRKKKGPRDVDNVSWAVGMFFFLVILSFNLLRFFRRLLQPWHHERRPCTPPTSLKWLVGACFPIFWRRPGLTYHQRVTMTRWCVFSVHHPFSDDGHAYHTTNESQWLVGVCFPIFWRRPGLPYHQRVTMTRWCVFSIHHLFADDGRGYHTTNESQWLVGACFSPTTVHHLFSDDSRGYHTTNESQWLVGACFSPTTCFPSTPPTSHDDSLVRIFHQQQCTPHHHESRWLVGACF
jgi:hypothetical protein